MQQNKIKLLKLVIVLLCFFMAVAGYFWNRQNGNQTKNVSASFNPAAQSRTIDVTVITATKQKVQMFQELPARVSAFKTSEVRPQVDGVIKKRTFEEGSFVKEGQQLYEIDPNVYQIAYDNANAALKTLKAKKSRYQNLLEIEAISKQEYDDTVSALTQAKSEVKKAKTNLTYTKVRAPISGYIGKSNITEGTLVTANQAQVLTTITQLDPIYVDMSEPTKDALELGNQREIPVSLILENSNYAAMGTLKFSEVFADESTDSVRLRAKFCNKDKKLIPGMFVSAKLHLKPIETILVPQRATNRGPDGNLSVWIVDAENTVKPRIIKAEQTFNDQWIVLEGLAEGEIIVYDGFLKISDGAKVNPTQLSTTTKDPVKSN